MKTLLTAFVLSASALTVQAQSDSTKALTISGYAEVYYGYDFNRPANHLSDGFLYNHNRHNEFNLNLGFIKAAYQTNRVRGNLALMAGTYAQYNLAAEPELLRHVFEANVGVKLAKDLWLDAGIMPSHLGFESAIGKDNWTLSRSLLAENSPYYETGAKLSYATSKWSLSALVLNGWQRIRRVDGNQTPALGWQVQYKPSDRVTLNSSSFIGNDKPDSTRQMRYFHNFYGIFQLNSKWGLITGFDSGWEQASKGSSDYNFWYSPVGILRFAATDRFALAARFEYYEDKKGVIIASPAPFQVYGYSLNADYRISDQVLARLEARQLSSSENVFQKNGGYTDQSTSIKTSISIAF
ncbi:hypothetical protein BWI97_08845 [Siphonobacter sp. BAB-5405]|uniref:porin n=1 Tax=Siphonobacter sp. BAB-5405 TaxID=1864825 RepID=UPI000C7FBF29|nr:porin [Siphonobacter sp. BAB-5405]PMD97167.1 hypothetical protein BWI97_08845 [Siphonobacter sp. BAB-5405]